jgi:purine-nucleoside/S-methyl-5'-thioadenosine phosphorylase / adenosine deaminase
VKLPAPFEWSGPHVAADLPTGRVRFTTRRGGVSTGPYASLNLGRLTGDHPEAVERNRARLAVDVGLPWERFAYGRQVHGADVAVVDGDVRQGREEDGQVTGRTDVATLVFTADCLAIALAADGAVGVLHGGWRGLAGGIVERGVAALREAGARGPVTALLGPAARGCCYEVGEEVHERFAAYDARVGERNLALDAVARAQLEAAGVREVHDTGLCTMCAAPELFFSHRRDRGVTGRLGAVAWRA